MEIDSEVEKVLRYRAKAVLRQRARALRNTIPGDAVKERSARIVASLMQLPVVAEAQSVAIFEPIEGRNEVDLRPLGEHLRQSGTRIAYPSIDAETREMTFRFVDNSETMEERGFGFREPDPSAPLAERLDVIVVPALQIDARGHRIGYGAGFYDRTLPRFAPPARSIGVVFNFQLIADVPITEGDIAVSLIVTDVQVLEPTA